ncbi:DUF6283 family protein [Acidovorax sp.]|uniref:DUF6283 family protein n=1 Tax=Acidovorax sp. TaxID=1872122 RepID=UPI00391EECC8
MKPPMPQANPSTADSDSLCQIEEAPSAWRTLPQPCPSCPWRIDQGAHDIPNFSIDKARALASTCPDNGGLGPSFGASIFACHQSNVGAEIACAGWLATVGRAHPSVRLAAMQGRLPVEALDPGEDWPELHENYGAVLQKLEGNCN